MKTDRVGMPVPCTGWLGKVFGHKFISRRGVRTDPAGCLRCGTPMGSVVTKATTTRHERRP